MALKLNIRSEIETEMDQLIVLIHAKSKTDYINQAINEFNQKIKRQLKVSQLKKYFSSYQKEAKTLLEDFSMVRRNGN